MKTSELAEKIIRLLEEKWQFISLAELDFVVFSTSEGTFFASYIAKEPVEVEEFKDTLEAFLKTIPDCEFLWVIPGEEYWNIFEIAVSIKPGSLVVMFGTFQGYPLLTMGYDITQ